jgi:type IV pilus assembly protein PilW
MHANIAQPTRRQAGFTLIELMVGVVVGLLATLVISNVLSFSEGQRRSTTSGSDAQVNGGLAIYALQRQLKMAGYGLSTEGSALGCVLTGLFNGAAPPNLPPTLAPVIITAGAGGAPDTVRILSSSKASFSLPTRVDPPYYDPAALDSKRNDVVVVSTQGFDQGDLVAMVYPAPFPGPGERPCQLFQVSAAPAGNIISRLDAGSWNAAGFPNQPAAASAWNAIRQAAPPFLVNLGAFTDITFSLTADFKLRQVQRNIRDQNATTRDLQPNIVAMRAFYGKDTNGDDVVDSFDAVTPASNAGWGQVRAVRIAVLARSGQFEKDEVTTTMPSWDVGTFAPVAGSVSCGSSKCVELKADVSSDWKHYRYKVFETLVPLRNQVWQSDFRAAPASQP